MTEVAPSSRHQDARHQKIVELPTGRRSGPNPSSAHLLARDGSTVTQATLSRDLHELDAVKVRTRGPVLVYAVPARVVTARRGSPSRPPVLDAAPGAASVPSSSCRADSRPTSSSCGPRRAQHSSWRRPSTTQP